MKNKTLKRKPSRNIEAARVLRREMTPAEKRLWNHVRKQQLGYKIRRQYPISGTPYVGDFCCPQAKLIIEVDGSIHDNQIEKDANRQAILEERGFKVIRYSNFEMFNHLEAVLGGIKLMIEAIINEK